ncbi:hypothetical protein TNCV_3867831 [Trichonephila clavipes]|nr:hypothetical protein TNCV_3867831 [Trichonephila clavipes]
MRSVQPTCSGQGSNSNASEEKLMYVHSVEGDVMWHREWGAIPRVSLEGEVNQIEPNRGWCCFHKVVGSISRAPSIKAHEIYRGSNVSRVEA